ncbi:MAG: transposase [bacterium LCO1.1]|uniref:Transposase n=1 Tax=Candidatus Weimeria bifida TaxID=2599074 RepID=A0A6N7IZH2_9FIRM|nr:transposase [Candidatus Weimeria bifida]
MLINQSLSTKVPEALIKKSYASSSAVAWTMYQKYVNSVPLYRQERLEAVRTALSRSTLEAGSSNVHRPVSFRS